MMRLRVLFLVDGFTDIRFVVGLSEICALTLATPAQAFRSSGLKERIDASGAVLKIDEIPGGRLAFQAWSLSYLLRHAGRFDVILAQEVTRGALNANLAGRLRGVPVLNTLALPPLEYYRCRRERGAIGWWKYHLGATVIRTLMALNGQLATGWLTLGRYLQTVARKHTRRIDHWGYYGVDTDYFRPAVMEERRALRRKCDLPEDAFLVFLASRVSHEKDPETALEAVCRVRQRGLNAIALNLGGGYRDFLELAERMRLPHAHTWVIGRPAAHPMKELSDYFRCVDVVLQASLEEGLGLSPLEGLACGTPVVATAVGGMAAQLPGHARLTPRRDPEAMAAELLWIAGHPQEARAQALRARETYVVPEWDRARTFADLRRILEQVASTGRMPERGGARRP